MRAIAVNEWGGRDKLELIEHEPPPVAPDGVLVRVKAAGVNPVDAKIREGYMAKALPFHFPVILGWDVAGVVEEVGPAVTWFKPGDKVYGYMRRHHLAVRHLRRVRHRAGGLLRAHARGALVRRRRRRCRSPR